MTVQDLPVGDHPKRIDIPYFPTRFQAFLWRNWGLVPSEKLAEVLQCSVEKVRQSAEELGLDPHVHAGSEWLTYGYLTLIRHNWHILDYEQLMCLLGWSADHLNKTLREEDFCFNKLGKMKPDCEKVVWRELSAVEKEQTAKICKIIRKNFPPEIMDYAEKPFTFTQKYHAEPVTGKDRFSFNFIHSYAASCGDIFLERDLRDPVPEKLMEQYASMGIKGVWMHAVLYLLEPVPGAEELSKGYELRRENLKKVAATCAKYGLKLYLYLNEPRTMPGDFYQKKPHWAGSRNGDLTANCINRTPEVLEWLENSCRSLFRRTPGLGGAYVIEMSENITHCNCRRNKTDCPYCRDIPDEDFLIRTITAIEKGIHSASPEADVIFSDWAWTYETGEKGRAFKEKVISMLPKKVCYATISEWGKPTNVGGIESNIVDYSISQIGPAPENAAMLSYAKSLGLKTLAKVQINNSWELSAVPYLPVPYLVREHLDNLKKLNVDGLMLSWTLGGYPGGNLALLRQTPEEMADSKFHKELSEKICEAWKTFSTAFREFPFHVWTLYYSPVNYGPMVPFYLEPTGRRASMIGFPYDDLKTWRNVYPEDVFENQFLILTNGWRKGVEHLLQAEKFVFPEERTGFQEIMTIAAAAYCHLRSTYLHIVFVRARNKGDHETMKKAVSEDRSLVMKLYEIARHDSRIGFEASNHYFYTLNDLREKILNCEYATSLL